jgi:hypothetical protein
MDIIIEKLNEIEDDEIEDDKNTFDNWTLGEIKKLLHIYFIISKKESRIFDLIYRYHDSDSWEDIFRDYDIHYLEDKAKGVEIAINRIMEMTNKEGYSSSWTQLETAIIDKYEKDTEDKEDKED